MKTKLILIGFVILCTGIEASAQLKVNSNGMVELNGGMGSSSVAPRAVINSNHTGFSGVNTAFSLLNKDMTNGNIVRLQFLSKLTDGTELDFATIGVQYQNHDVKARRADFHILTDNKGLYESRFIIYSNENNNNVKFHFRTGSGGSGGLGAWIDDSGSGEVTFRPNGDQYGFLGTPSHNWYKLYSYHAYFKNQPVISSDVRMKKDIKEIDSDVISKIGKVRPVSYILIDNQVSNNQRSNKMDTKSFAENRLGTKESVHQEIKKEEKMQYGFIAQELKEIFPEVVVYDSVTDDYGIMYTALIPIMMEALKEQQQQILVQKNELEELKTEMITYLSNNSSSENIRDEMNTKRAKLFQNTPNPFSEKTEIRYTLPEKTVSAKMLVTNMQGAEVKSYNLNPTQAGMLIIKGNELKAGLYMYTLLVNNQIIDTKRMVLTK